MDPAELALLQAQRAWPAIVVDANDFRQSLLRATAGDLSAIAALCVEDLYLARACAAGDARALAAFDARYLAQIGAMLSRHRAAERADEVAQIVRERLFVARADGPPRISDYTGRGPLTAWLRVVTLRAASNLVRSERPTTPLGEDDLVQTLGETPELRVLESRYRHDFRAAFREAFAALEPAERTVLKLSFLDGVSVRKLAPVLGVSPATAGRRLLDAQHRLGELVFARLGERVQAAPDELASVVRALLSRLDISLSALVHEV
jgi:RNA polymerase sigma-70 factor (ECF subfamily)